MLLQMEWLCPLVLLCAATCAMSSRGLLHSLVPRAAGDSDVMQLLKASRVLSSVRMCRHDAALIWS